MMSKWLVTIGTASVLAFVGSAHSYEVQTHSNLTRHAYDQSILADPVLSPLLAFGVEDQGAARFSTRSVDDLWPFPDLPSFRTTPREVIAIGAHQEDIPTQEGRFLKHFYDVQQGGIGLTSFGLGPFLPSPDWVLEDQGTVASQQDSLRDALEFHRLALIQPQQEDRDTNLTRLLEIIGRSVHHLQDMSQPAHVRNDAHQPGDGDIYESSTNRLYGLNNGDTIPRQSPYPSGPVDLSIFNTARKFWTNSGRGIAEFTSNNFVSKDTNFRMTLGGLTPDPAHASPVATGTHTITLGELDINTPLPTWTPMTFVRTQVHDRYPSDQYWANDRAATWSVFAPDLQSTNYSVAMTQNRFNFEMNYEFLFPRAIAFSAGLINYYFRGRLKVEDISSSGAVTTITIRNRSAPDFALGAAPLGFRLFYDAADGQRHEIDFEELDDPGAELQFDATRRFSFTTPVDVDVRKQAQYVLMFDGTIGSEAGVAAVAFGTAYPGFSIVPHYATTDGVTGARRVVSSNNVWRAANDAEYWAGPIDWKGHKPEDVLTWGRGNSRYDYYGSSGGPVYMNGRVLTTARGCIVMGTSIRYIDGLRVLNVACGTDSSVRIYSRTFAERYENEDMWSDVNPLGWRLVYSGAYGEKLTGFFFNARGTEGQFITRDPITHGPDRRVKVTLSGFTGTAEDFPATATVTQTHNSFQETSRDVSVQAGYCAVIPNATFGGVLPQPGDSCQRREYSGIEQIGGRLTVTQAYVDRTLFCVDYRGDQEVLCELLPPAPIVSEIVGNNTIEQQVRGTNGTCGLSDRHDTQLNITRTEHHNYERLMKIGDLEIPWTSIRNGQTFVQDWDGNWDSSSAIGTDYVTASTFQSNATSRTTRLIQFDARHDFALYEEHLFEEEFEEGGTYATSTGGSPYTTARESTTSDRVVMRLGGDRQVLFEEIDPQSVSTTGVTPGASQWGVLDGCLPGNGPQETSTVTTFVDPAVTTDIYSSMSTKGSYAIDRAGRLGLSQEITGFDVPHTSLGYQNVLTGGDLPTIIPGTPSSEGYRYSIRLVR